ncbi:MAG: RHS repeat-associated core domain-containing protein [Phycisphaerae bacterium]
MYRYDAWNRLVGVWYADGGGTSDAGQRVAAYAYDALFRRVSKTVSNQGLGCVHGSDAGGMAGIQAGDRAEHYFYSGWRLIEERDGSDRTLAQTVYGTQYIDEPICRDRNTDPVAGGSPDNDCLDSGGSQRYFYHQDANYRVTLLTGETGGVVERYDYSAYGEPAVFGGAISGGLGESRAALTVSTVGNPLMHQGLFRDGESGSYQNRYRQTFGLLGRLSSQDPRGYVDGLGLFAYELNSPLNYVDAFGGETKNPTTKPGEDDGNPLPAHVIQGGAQRGAEKIGEKIGEAIDRPAPGPQPIRPIPGVNPPRPPGRPAPPAGGCKVSPSGGCTKAAEERITSGKIAGATAGAIVSGIFQLEEVREAYGKAIALSNKFAPTFARDVFLLHLADLDRQEDTEVKPKDFDANGVYQKPFYTGGGCGTCSFQCICNPNNQQARVFCWGGRNNCNGVVNFANPRQNPCTFFCDKQAKCKGTPAQGGGGK